MGKSISSMLSAIEIYNKPDFKYREEGFIILSINAWELLFKARILKLNKYNKKSIYSLESDNQSQRSLFDKKTSSSRKRVKRNKSGNEITIGIYKCITKLKEKKEIPPNLENNLRLMIEMRDNAVHFYNESIVYKKLQEIGYACVKNFVEIIKKWDFRTDLSKFKLHLMPIAYIDSNMEVKGLPTDQEKNYLDYFNKKASEEDDRESDYKVGIWIDIGVRKSKEGIGIKHDKHGIPVTLSEEDITEKFPLCYKDITGRAKKRYTNFKVNNSFHKLMKNIKKDRKLSYERKHNPKKAKSGKTFFYNTNIWRELDKHYTKK